MFRDPAVLLLATGQTLIWASLFYVFPASLLAWEADLGWPREQLTLAISLAILTSGLAAPLAGRLIDSGRGPVMMGAAAALGGTVLVLLTRVSAPWQFIALWVVLGGLMAGTLYEATFAMLTRARGAGAKPGIVRITLAAGFAGTISFPVVHALTEAVGWRAALAAMGVFVILCVAPMLWQGARLLERGVVSAPAFSHSAPRRHGYLRLPVFWFLGLGFGLSAIVHGATLQHLLPLLDERGLPDTFAVGIAAMIGPMQVAGRLGMALLGDRVSHRGVALIALSALAMSVAILALSGTVRPAIVAFVLLFGSAYGTVSILRPLLARDLLGEADFGAKSGALALLYMLGAASSAWAGSLIWAFAGYGVMLATLVALALVATGLLAAAHRGTRL